MLLFLLVLMVLLIFINLVLLELFLYLVYLLVEETTDVGLLLDQDLGGFVLNGSDVILNLFVELVYGQHSVSVGVVEAAL